MSKIMLINVTHPEESRVGIVNNGVLESFEIESFAREHLKGNIYKGVVHRIHPALEAAFVDIGGDRDAFLPLDEICFKNLPGNGQHEGRPRIKEILKPGQEILVQIVKDEFASKPPTLSTFFSLPGRYLVLLPGSDGSGISRRIEGEERARLRAIIEELDPPEGFGVIIRTAAGFDQSKGELQRDFAYLRRLWDNIQKGVRQKREPGLVYREHDLVMRNIRDYFTPDIDEIWVDNEEVFQRARDFLHNVMPGKEKVLRVYQGDQPIFSAFSVEAEIESIYKRRVSLRSGGSIVIDGTEALTAIDVNSGGSIRGGNQEETAFRTNTEAANEIARQLRLRDLGGLIVIDFIDMRQPTHNREVEQTLRQAMKPDKARHDIGHISRLGLLEVSRQRLRPAASASSYTSCPMCEGHGLVRTTESATLVALRKIHNRIAQGDAASLKVSLPPDVALYLLNQKREDLAALERRYATRIQIAQNGALMPHQSEFEARARTEGSRPVAKKPRPGEVAEAAVEAVATPVAAPAAAAAVNGTAAQENGNGEGKKKRRRGRRRGRGRGRQAAAALADALTSLGASAGLYVPEQAAPNPTALLEEDDDFDELEMADEVAGEAPAVAVEQAEAPASATGVEDELGARVPEPVAIEAPAAKPRASRARSAKSGGAKRAPARASKSKPEGAEKPKAAPRRTAARKTAPKKTAATRQAPRKRAAKKTATE
jgi:ribonuclease E